MYEEIMNGQRKRWKTIHISSYRGDLGRLCGTIGAERQKARSVGETGFLCLFGIGIIVWFRRQRSPESWRHKPPQTERGLCSCCNDPS